MIARQEKILVVDDENVVRKLLCQRLSNEGYQCLEADSGDQALEILKGDQIGLVLLDIKMPGKSGTELLPEIKERYSDTAVIMITAIVDTNIAVQCMKQRAYDYIIKPFNLEEVILSVERALERRRLEIENRGYRLHLEQKVEEQARKIRDAYVNSITALAYALDAKDHYTSGHSQRVTEIAVAIARELGLPPHEIDKIRLAGLLHALGKIGVREDVLLKPGKLTAEEYQHVKSHPESAEHISRPVVEDDEVLAMIRHHHEHYDGSGYPDGHKGEQIPLGARILAVADAYNAMTSERPYRKAMSPEKALAELERNKGSQFCPKVVDAFLKVGKSLGITA